MTFWFRCQLLIAAVLAAGVASAGPDDRSKTVGTLVNIKLVLEETTLLATLDDSAAARDFAALLPLELTLSDYSSTEKIADLPRRLSTQGAPDGFEPKVGDITYFAPWGNLALFYRDFHYSRGLIRLGHIEGDVGLLEGKRDIKVRIELWNQ